MPKKKSSATQSPGSASLDVLGAIRNSALDIEKKILARKKPTMKFPVRSLSNVRYHPDKGYFEIAGQKKERTLTVNTVKTFAQTLRMIALSKNLVENDDIATKREAYYVSKNWEDARFTEQPESDTVMDDVEAYFSVNREQLGFIPEEKGGDVAGRLVVLDRDRDSGKVLRIDCTKFGTGAYSVPITVEHLLFETNAEFILVIETAGMFQRLVKHNYWKKANCILISMGGVPTRACRRFIRRLADFKKIPVYVFVDGDPYGITNIYRTLKVGSGNAAHMNEFFCVPQASLSRRHPAGYHRLQAADPSAQGRGHQARPRCDQERPFYPAPQGLGHSHGAAPADGRACRTASPGKARLELRDR